MCGIVGIIGHEFDSAALQQAVAMLYHRGPDDAGIYIDREHRVGLGHSRLAIIDPQTGQQPLHDPGGNLVLVCNGEIYDHERIRDELISQGHRFSTGSDNEVILYLYRQFGLDFVHHLRGEFAFLLYDRAQQKLLAVRDRFGIKPLFFNRQGHRYLFGSEAKALFATGKLQPEVDHVAVRDFMSRVSVDSIFTGVDVVPPGSMLVVNLADQTDRLEKYWDLDLACDQFDTTESSLAECAQLLRQQFDEAVRLRLRADVPVGVNLSGGIDSSVVAASVAQQSSTPLKVFTISFPDDPAIDETHQATCMAEKIGAQMYTVECRRTSLIEQLQSCLWITELPCEALHGVGKFLLSQLACQHVKVVLTGEGADELLLGYGIFRTRKSQSARRTSRLQSMKTGSRRTQIENIERELGFIPIDRYIHLFGAAQQRRFRAVFDRRHRADLAKTHPVIALGKDIDRHHIDDWPHMSKAQYYMFKRSLAPYSLCVLGDRQEMSHSVEGRPPFLDHHFVEAINAIPYEFKVRNGVDKFILRHAMKDRIPAQILENPKFGYKAPPVEARRGADRMMDDRWAQFCGKSAIETAGLFDAKAVHKLMKSHSWSLFGRQDIRQTQRQMMAILSVQMIDDMFVQNLDSRIKQASVAAEARWSQVRRIDASQFPVA